MASKPSEQLIISKISNLDRCGVSRVNFAAAREAMSKEASGSSGITCSFQLDRSFLPL
jgi:hypothetical protein